MSARTDFEPWSWEEAEQNRRPQTPARFLHHRRTDFVAAQPATEPAKAPERRVVSVLEQCEQLQGELKRGQEYLEKVRRELNEHREMLEEWPSFEKHCGKDPLAYLAQSTMVSERIAEFLSGWLKRREQRLTELSGRIAVAKTSRRNRAQEHRQA